MHFQNYNIISVYKTKKGATMVSVFIDEKHLVINCFTPNDDITCGTHEGCIMFGDKYNSFILKGGNK